MKYIKQFNNHSDYNTYITSNDAIFPNVSYCISENDVHIGKKYTLTINYINKSTGQQVAQTQTHEYICGSNYDRMSPIIEGYTANYAHVIGIMPHHDLTVNVEYTINYYTLTIVYKYGSTTMAPTYTHDYAYGETFSVPSPIIEGYTCVPATITGTMRTSPTTRTVNYTPNDPGVDPL